MMQRWSAKGFVVLASVTLSLLSSIGAHLVPRSIELKDCNQNPPTVGGSNRSHIGNTLSSWNFEESSSSSSSPFKRQSQSPIPNPNLDYSDLRQSGSFYTSKDFASSVFNFEEQNFDLRSSLSGVDLYINSSVTFQEVDYGDAVTDSTAFLLMQIRDSNRALYEQTMEYLYNIRTGRRIARVPMGASDFSVDRYTYQESAKSDFSISPAENIATILVDAKARQPDLKIILSPWTPPARWKTPQTQNGGTFNSQYTGDYAQYFVDTARAYDALGLRPFAFTIQNEPFHAAAYPSMFMDSQQQASLASSIRSQLNSNGFRDVKILAHDHNYDLVSEAIETVKINPDTFDGCAFHGYNGSVDQLQYFKEATDDMPVYVTEMSAEVDNTSSQWTVMYFWLRTLFFPATELNSRSVMLWNVALNQDFGPRLPLAFCTDCIGSLEVTPENTFSLYPQAHVISHFSAATSSLKSLGGSVSRRVGVDFPRKGHYQASSWLGCLDSPLGFASSFEGDNLDNKINGTNYEKEKRIGIVISNKCDDSFRIRIGVDDQSFNFRSYPGLTTLTFALNSTQTSSSRKITIGHLWIYAPLFVSILFVSFSI